MLVNSRFVFICSLVPCFRMKMNRLIIEGLKLFEKERGPQLIESIVDYGRYASNYKYHNFA